MLPATRNLATKKIRGKFCLDYVGGTFTSGYGAVWVKNSSKPTGKKRPANERGTSRRAHVVAYEEAYGPVPAGKLVLHHCDRPICIEPEHLYAGTQKQNVEDMMARGRFVASGLKHDDAKVAAIRAAVGRQVDIARRFGVTQGYVSDVKRGKQRAG